MTKPSNKQTPEAVSAKPQTSTAGVIVLQWLTYAFWGWLILGLIWLMSIILLSTLLAEPVGDMISYSIAAIVVLLPLAFICDLFYRKHEPAKKAGGAMVIMIIHAVIFAILGITSLIIAVFVGLNLVINIGGDTDAQTIGVVTAIFAAILYSAAFIRTLNPFKSKKPSAIYGISMLAIAAIMLITAFAGPVVKSVATRQDRLIEQNITTVQYEINNYLDTNGALPESLNQLPLDTMNSQAVSLIDDKLVEYIPDGTEPVVNNNRTAFRYQLCTEYVASTNTFSGMRASNGKTYQSYLSPSPHDKGRVCYKIEAYTYQN